MWATDRGDGDVAFQIGLGFKRQERMSKCIAVRDIWKQFHENFKAFLSSID
jgi:hypothetical protein